MNLEKKINKNNIKAIIKTIFPNKIKWNAKDISIQYLPDTHLFYFDKISKINKNINSSLKSTEGVGLYINEYELLYLLKEWIYSQGYELVSGKSKTLLDWACIYDIETEEDYENYVCVLNFKEDNNGGGYTGKDLDFEIGFMGKTELESILEAINFILKQKKQK